MTKTAENSATRLLSGVVAAAERAPWAVLGAYALALALSVWAATGLRIDTDSSRMLNPELPFQTRALELREAFPQDKTAILIAIRGEDADRADLVATRLIAALEGQPGVAQVFAPSVDPFFLAHGMFYLSLEEFDRQISRISSSSNLIASLREDQTRDGFLRTLDEARQLAEGAGRPEDLDLIYAEAAEVFRAAAEGRARPFRWSGAFSGETGPVLRLITVQPELDFTALNPAKPAMAAVDAAISALGAQPGLEIGVTGDPVLRAEELRAVSGKIGLSLGLSLVFVAVVLWLALGSLGRMGLGLGALVVTLVLTTGAAAVMIGSLNLISIAFIVLMVGLGIDFAIHFLAHLDEQSRSGAGALARTGGAIGPALALAAASTSFAFLAFATSDFIGMAQLGLIGAVGVVLAFLVSLTLIPALVARRPNLARGAPRGRVPRLRGGALAFWLALAVGLGSVSLAIEARFDADPMSLRDPDAPSVQAFGWLTDAPGRSLLRASALTASAEEAARLATTGDGLAGVESTVWLGSLIPDEQGAKLDLLDLAWPSIDNAVNGPPTDLAEARA
ncbi:MAG: MMPL family transporter, partial [Pseudomonadota bacterium]